MVPEYFRISAETNFQADRFNNDDLPKWGESFTPRAPQQYTAEAINLFRSGGSSMKLYLFLSLVLLVASVASAAPDNIILGPYNVSFDLGNVTGYQIEVDEPKSSESLEGVAITRYRGWIRGSGDSIAVSLMKFDIPPDLNLDPLAVLMYASSGIVTEGAHREIDDTQGAVALERNSDVGDIYNSLYFPEFARGTLQCLILSTYPWDEGTLSLLRTIHIEEVWKIDPCVRY